MSIDAFQPVVLRVLSGVTYILVRHSGIIREMDSTAQGCDVRTNTVWRYARPITTVCITV